MPNNGERNWEVLKLMDTHAAALLAESREELDRMVRCSNNVWRRKMLNVNANEN